MKKPNRVFIMSGLYKLVNDLEELNKDANPFYRLTFDILTDRVGDRTILFREIL